MPQLKFILTREPIACDPAPWTAEFGAEISFFGVVRGTENGDPISGIDYSAYPAMVQHRADGLGRTAAKKFPAHRATITHRYGFVLAAEPSVHIQVGSRHSRAAFDICTWYLNELKAEIPIWKRIVPHDQ